MKLVLKLPHFDRHLVFFASGTDHAGEIRGFADLGIPVGSSIHLGAQ